MTSGTFATVGNGSLSLVANETSSTAAAASDPRGDRPAVAPHAANDGGHTLPQMPSGEGGTGSMHAGRVTAPSGRADDAVGIGQAVDVLQFGGHPVVTGHFGIHAG